MGTFKSTKTFFASPEIIPAIVKDITGTFTNEGYQVQAQDLISGGYDISITKGNMFKAVLGMVLQKRLSLKPWGIALKFLFLHHENILFPND